jgi:hypothetical protein
MDPPPIATGPAALRNRQATHLDAGLTEPEHNQLRIHSVISHSGPSERGAPGRRRRTGDYAEGRTDWQRLPAR